jgi:hypothetical protein
VKMQTTDLRNGFEGETSCVLVADKLGAVGECCNNNIGINGNGSKMTKGPFAGRVATRMSRRLYCPVFANPTFFTIFLHVSPAFLHSLNCGSGYSPSFLLREFSHKRMLK